MGRKYVNQGFAYTRQCTTLAFEADALHVIFAYNQSRRRQAVTDRQNLGYTTEMQRNINTNPAMSAPPTSHTQVEHVHSPGIRSPRRCAPFGKKSWAKRPYVEAAWSNVLPPVIWVKRHPSLCETACDRRVTRHQATNNSCDAPIYKLLYQMPAW